MSTLCRYCGDIAEAADGDACPRCAASPECDRCGHPRSAHVGTFRDGRGCAHVWVEEPATLTTGCACAGFAPAVSGSLDEDLLLVVEGRQGAAIAPGR
jgi:hypothetical protein